MYAIRSYYDGAPLIEEIYRSLSKEYKWIDWKPDTIQTIPIDSGLIKRIVGRYSGLSRDKEEFQFELINQSGVITSYSIHYTKLYDYIIIRYRRKGAECISSCR